MTGVTTPTFGYEVNLGHDTPISLKILEAADDSESKTHTFSFNRRCSWLAANLFLQKSSVDDGQGTVGNGGGWKGYKNRTRDDGTIVVDKANGCSGQPPGYGS